MDMGFPGVLKGKKYRNLKDQFLKSGISVGDQEDFSAAK